MLRPTEGNFLILRNIICISVDMFGTSRWLGPPTVNTSTGHNWPTINTLRP